MKRITQFSEDDWKELEQNIPRELQYQIRQEVSRLVSKYDYAKTCAIDDNLFFNWQTLCFDDNGKLTIFKDLRFDDLIYVDPVTYTNERGDEIEYKCFIYCPNFHIYTYFDTTEQEYAKLFNVEILENNVTRGYYLFVDDWKSKLPPEIADTLYTAVQNEIHTNYEKFMIYVDVVNIRIMRYNKILEFRGDEFREFMKKYDIVCRYIFDEKGKLIGYI